jgi:hypothetical protein
LSESPKGTYIRFEWPLVLGYYESGSQVRKEKRFLVKLVGGYGSTAI